jgi:AraC-like DNA-binding protein
MLSVFEKIEHQRQVPAKVFITQVESCRLHWHYDYELLVILSGNLRVFSGPEPFVMSAGDIALFNTKDIHGFSGTGAENLCLCIQFSPVFFSSVLSDRQAFYFYLNSVTGIFPPLIPYKDFVTAACRIGQAFKLETPFSRMRMTALLQSLATDLVEFTEYEIRSAAIDLEDRYSGDTFNEISNYIDSNLADVNLADNICRIFRMTSKQIYRYLKNASGLTLKDLIDSARIEKSKRLLRETNIKISVIADDCGFMSEATFFRVFHESTGMTPKDYRHGMDSFPLDKVVQGYLNFNERKAEQLLEEFCASLSA